MKTIIAGGRTLVDPSLVEGAMATCPWTPTEIVSGGASGVDGLGEAWATSNNIPIQRFPAQWKKHGRAAGPIRNREMAEYAEALVAIWDGKSKGTKSMIGEARKRDLVVHIHRL